MTRQKIEKWVNRVLAKPVSLVLYGLWLAGCVTASATKRSMAWLAQRWSRRSADAANAGK